MSKTATEPFLLHAPSPNASLLAALRHTPRLRPTFASLSPSIGIAFVVVLGFVGLGMVLATLDELAPLRPLPVTWSLLGSGLLLGFANVLQCVRWQWRRRTLMNNGRMLDGCVLHCVASGVYCAPSREHGTGEATWFFTVSVTYAFRAPENELGEWVVATDSAVRNDLQGCLELPSAGQAVRVLYLNDQHFVLL